MSCSHSHSLDSTNGKKGLIRAADDDDDFTLATTTRTRKKKDTDDQVKIAKREIQRPASLRVIPD